MSKKKSSKKQKEAEARTKVNGHAAFENGKLIKPTATDELLETLKEENARLKEELSKRTRTVPKLEELPNVEDCPIQYINFCQVQKARDELKYILAEVEKIPGIEIRHNAYMECYRINNKLVGELFPLRRKWSARINPGIVKRWDTADEYLEALKARIAEIPAKVEQPKPVVNASKSKKIESVEDIKGRIEKLTGGRNAIHLKSVTPEIEALAKNNSYKLLKSEAGGYDLIVSRLQ